VLFYVQFFFTVSVQTRGNLLITFGYPRNSSKRMRCNVICIGGDVIGGCFSFQHTVQHFSIHKFTELKSEVMNLLGYGTL